MEQNKEQMVHIIVINALCIYYDFVLPFMYTPLLNTSFLFDFNVAWVHCDYGTFVNILGTVDEE